MAMAVRKPHPQAPWGEFVPGVGPLTSEQFEQFVGDAQWYYELHQGRLIRMPGPGGEHARIQARLITALQNHLDANKLGNAYGTSCYIFQFPDGSESILCPDVSYSLPNREAAAPYRGSYQVLTPDLIAEVVSPNDTRPDVQHKVSDYLRAGVRLVWTLWPKTRTIEVWESTNQLAPTTVFIANALLNGGSVLPGFVCAVNDIFR